MQRRMSLGYIEGWLRRHRLSDDCRGFVELSPSSVDGLKVTAFKLDHRHGETFHLEGMISTST
jgi:hypothetical protein